MTASTDDGMHHEAIKAAIRETGITAEGLSERWGYDRSAIAVTLKRPWPAVQELIASYLGRDPRAIWPERYDESGRPRIPKQSDGKSNASPTARNRELADAAWVRT